MVLAEVIPQVVAITLHSAGAIHLEVASYLLAVAVIHLEQAVTQGLRAIHLGAEARALLRAVGVIHLRAAVTLQMAILGLATVASLLPGSAPVAKADLDRAASLLERKQDTTYAPHLTLPGLPRPQQLKNTRVLPLFHHQCTWQSSPIVVWKWNQRTWHVSRYRAAPSI